MRHLAAAGLLTRATARAARSDHDRDTAISACASLGFAVVLNGPAPADPDEGATWEEVSEEARQMVAELWGAVRAVAAAVLAAPGLTLSGAEVSRIVARYLR